MYIMVVNILLGPTHKFTKCRKTSKLNGCRFFSFFSSGWFNLSSLEKCMIYYETFNRQIFISSYAFVVHKNLQLCIDGTDLIVFNVSDEFVFYNC